ncbi:MAG TPA: DUF2079 domain-containing protein [Thermoplasmata archaeon]|nr:DUF2079 domain-containing protein [Thermoplasmata archaeon]
MTDDWVGDGFVADEEAPYAAPPRARPRPETARYDAELAAPSVPGPAAPIRSLPRWIPPWLARHLSLPLLLLGVLVVVEAVALASLQWSGFLAFQSVPNDLASYNQAFFTTVHSGAFFYYTTNLPSGGSGALFGTHFVPFFALLLPFYAAAPGPGTLIAIKSSAIALGAIPVYALARLKLPSRWWAFACGVVYLVSPLTLTLDWNGFDPEAFLPVTVLSAVYFLAARKPWAFVASWVVALSVIETIAPLLLVFAAVGLASVTWQTRRTGGPLKDMEGRLLVLGAVSAALWLAMAYAVLVHFNPQGATFGPGYARRFTVLGAPTIPSVGPQALLHPDLALAALGYDGQTKTTYLLLLFGGLGFLPLVGSARNLFPAVAWSSLAVLSNSVAFYTLGTQYLGYVSPFLVAGFIAGVARARGWFLGLPAPGPSERSAVRPPPALLRLRSRRLRWRERAPLAFAVFCTFVATIAANPLLSAPAAATPFNTYGVPSPTPHDTQAMAALNAIPPTSSVYCTEHLYPYLSSRGSVYTLSSGGAFAGATSYWGWMQRYINSSEFVAIDYPLDPTDALLTQYYGNLAGFGLVAAADGTYVFERGWGGAPSQFVPASIATAGGALTPLDARVNPAATTELGASLYHAADKQPGATVWTGPRESPIPPGSYRATVWLKLQAPSAGSQLKIAFQELPIHVTAAQTLNTSTNHRYSFTIVPAGGAGATLATTNVTTSAGTTRWVDLNVTVSFAFDTLASFTTTGVELSGSASFTVYGITLSQTQASIGSSVRPAAGGG